LRRTRFGLYFVSPGEVEAERVHREAEGRGEPVLLIEERHLAHADVSAESQGDRQENEVPGQECQTGLGL